jgi:peptide deformylase
MNNYPITLDSNFGKKILNVTENIINLYRKTGSPTKGFSYKDDDYDLNVVVYMTSAGPKVMLNPEIIGTSEHTENFMIACPLSKSNAKWKVRYPTEIIVAHLDTDGLRTSTTFTASAASYLSNVIEGLHGISVEPRLSKIDKLLYKG